MVIPLRLLIFDTSLEFCTCGSSFHV